MQALPSSQDPPLVGMQVPTAPAVLQAMHGPQDVPVVLQQTPSTQLPEEHSAVVRHGEPGPDPFTSTEKVTLDWLLEASVAVHVTVWWPTSKWPGGGVQVTVAGPLI